MRMASFYLKNFFLVISTPNVGLEPMTLTESKSRMVFQPSQEGTPTVTDFMLEKIAINF